MPHGLQPLAGVATALIERAHDELVAGNTAGAEIDAVRPLVRESWRRSLGSAAGLRSLPPLDYDPEQLREVRGEHPLSGLIRAVQSLLLPGDPRGSGLVVAVGDAAGRLLWVEGDRELRASASEMGFVAGANWSEAVVGTAAPGTALRVGRTVQIRGPEHFNLLAQRWSCTAAPVRDPETRSVLGVIDITGGAGAATFEAQLLVDAAVRALEAELHVERLKQRAGRASKRPPRKKQAEPTAALRVLGRDRAQLTVTGDAGERSIELSARHSEMLLMLQLHRQGLSAERLGDLVYGGAHVRAIRPEIVRLRAVLTDAAPHLRLESRPYRLRGQLSTDFEHVQALIERGAHRAALGEYLGEPMPGSAAPGVEDARETLRQALRGALMHDAKADLLVTYCMSDAGADDAEAMRLALALLPPRSPKRTVLAVRLERLEAESGPA